MKNLILYIGILIYLTFTNSVALYWGIEQVGISSSIVLLAILLYEFLIGANNFYKLHIREELFLIIIFIFYSILQYSISDFEPIRVTLYFIVIPVIISILIKLQSVNTKIGITRILVAFFFIECGLAMYERFFEINLFPYRQELDYTIEFESWMFRSSALLGHPLNNALGVSIICGFILVSNYKVTFKFFCSIITLISMLCFNARGATIFWICLLIYYTYVYIKSGRMSIINKTIIFMFIFLAFCGGVFVLLNSSLGGRIANEGGLLDSSAMTRLDAFTAFDYISTYDLMFGNFKNYEIVTKKLQAAGVENAYIVILIRYGIIVGTLLIISLFFIVKKYFIIYSGKNKFILFVSFVLIGSLNNSLVGSTPWIIFFLCGSTFPFLDYYPMLVNQKNLNHNFDLMRS